MYVEPQDGLAGSDEQVISFRIDLVATLAPLLFTGRQFHLERGDDGAGHFVLNLEDVFNSTVVAFGPEMTACRSVDHLGVDPDPIGGTANAAFKHVANAEIAADLADIRRPALIGEGGIAGDDEEA